MVKRLSLVWVTYGTKYYSAKEHYSKPGRSVTIKDAEAYGVIVTQGHGRLGTLNVSTPSMIRFSQMTEDEFFVTASRARDWARCRESWQFFRPSRFC